LTVEGQPKQVFSQTLLLIPSPKATALNIPDPEVYIDKKTKEEFVALVISTTKPRNKVKVHVPVEPPNPLMQIRPVLGQGGYHESRELWIICPNRAGEFWDCKCRELMAKAFVQIVRHCPLSNFKYRQVVTQLEAYEENQRISNALAAIRKTGCPLPSWSHFLQFVPATEADSVLLVSHDGDDIKIQMSATQCLACSREDDSSIHSTIPLKSSTPTESAASVTGISKTLLEKFEKEYDEKFKQAGNG